MNKKNIFLKLIILLILLVVIYASSRYYLNLHNLTYTHIVNNTFIMTLTIIFSSIFVITINFLNDLKNRKSFDLLLLILNRLSILIIVIMMILTLLFSFVIIAFAGPQHFVYKNGNKVVASVNSFLQVKVDYYDYKNPFIMGNQLRISEDYGNGGYDPFKHDEMPPVKNYIYFDKNGNVTDSNYLDD